MNYIRLTKRSQHPDGTLNLHALELLGKEDRALDVTELDLGCLPHIVSAKLFSSAESFVATRLTIVQDIELPHAKYVNIPNLRAAKNIDVSEAKEVSIHRLEMASSIFAPAVHKLYSPNLKHVSDDIDASEARTISAEMLVKVGGKLIVSEATTLDLNLLETTKDFRASEVRSFTLPQLKAVFGDLDVRNAQSVAANQLELVSGIIYAPKAMIIAAQRLKHCEALHHNAGNVQLLVPDSVIGPKRAPVPHCGTPINAGLVR